MSIFHKGVKVTDFYKLEDEIGRYRALRLFILSLI
jgi:hypothetical protein